MELIFGELVILYFSTFFKRIVVNWVIVERRIKATMDAQEAWYTELCNILFPVFCRTEII